MWGTMRAESVAAVFNGSTLLPAVRTCLLLLRVDVCCIASTESEDWNVFQTSEGSVLKCSSFKNRKLILSRLKPS